MNQRIVRHLRDEDYADAIAVIIRSTRISQGRIYPKTLIDAFCTKYEPEAFKIRASEIDYFVAVDNNAGIVGIIGLQRNRIRTFFVDPDFQGKGIGRQLYTYLEIEARKRGLTEIFVEGSPLAEPVYIRFGFIKIKELQKEKAGISYTDAYMVKRLV